MFHFKEINKERRTEIKKKTKQSKKKEIKKKT
jgi:hypothetical protein